MIYCFSYINTQINDSLVELKPLLETVRSNLSVMVKPMANCPMSKYKSFFFIENSLRRRKVSLHINSLLYSWIYCNIKHTFILLRKLQGLDWWVLSFTKANKKKHKILKMKFVFSLIIHSRFRFIHNTVWIKKINILSYPSSSSWHTNNINFAMS